jgi:hypothetical protein
MPGYVRPCVRTHARLHVYARATHARMRTHARTHACRPAPERTSPACALHMHMHALHAHAAASSPDTVLRTCACCLRKQMRIRCTHSAIANASLAVSGALSARSKAEGTAIASAATAIGYTHYRHWLQAGCLRLDGQGCSAAALSSAGAVDFSLSGSVSARDHRERRTRGTDSLAHALVARACACAQCARLRSPQRAYRHKQLAAHSAMLAHTGTAAL